MTSGHATQGWHRRGCRGRRSQRRPAGGVSAQPAQAVQGWAWGPNDPYSGRVIESWGGDTKSDEPIKAPWLVNSPHQIKAYQGVRYEALYNERKFAQPFPKQRQTLSFMGDLPTELRVQIYGYVCPLPNNVLELMAPRPCSGSWRKGGSADELNILWNQRKPVGQLVSMMRLSKRARDEIADVFFGRTNLHFTRKLGIATFSSWMNTIGGFNKYWVRNLTIQLPHRTVKDFSSSQPSNSAWVRWERDQRGLGLKERDWGWKRSLHGTDKGMFKFDRAVTCAFTDLESLPQLKKLELLIPWNHELMYYTYKDESDGDEKFVSCNFLDPREGETPCGCEFDYVNNMAAEDLIWHMVEEHSTEPYYWRMLSLLKQKSKSQCLEISLVIDYEGSPFITGSPFASYKTLSDRTSEDTALLRQVKWIKAYADVMGYRFGQTHLEGGWEIPYEDRKADSLERFRDFRICYGEGGILDDAESRDAQHRLLEPPAFTAYKESS